MNSFSKYHLFKLCLILPMIVTLCSALLSPHLYVVFSSFRTPPLTPDPAFFPFFILLLNVLNGFMAYHLCLSKHYEKAQAIKLVLASYFFLFFWPILFAEYQLTFFAFIWCLALVLIVLCLFLQLLCIQYGCAILVLPFLLWCVFLCYINLGIVILN